MNAGPHTSPSISRYDEQISREIEQELALANEAMKSNEQSSIPAFDIRGELYRLALHNIAPSAREEERTALIDKLSPQKDEIGVDLGAGTGFVTSKIAELTQTTLYAVDVSEVQLEAIASGNPSIKLVPMSPDSELITQLIPPGSIDFVTSLGVLHHVSNKLALFRNVLNLLKPGGRFVAADVCADTMLSAHFDRVVSKKCITGHVAQWLSEAGIKQFAEISGLELVSAEMISPRWKFRDVPQMCLFFKALHAYPDPLSVINEDLRTELNVSDEPDGGANVTWPLLIFELRKKQVSSLRSPP